MLQIRRNPINSTIILHQRFSFMIFYLLTVGALSSCVSLSPAEKSEKADKKNEFLAGEILLIQKFLDQGQAEKAWSAMRPVLRKYPDKPGILNLAGLIHLALENHLKAINLFRKSFRLKPDTATGLNLSSSYIAYGNYDKARKLLVQLIKAGQSYKYPERLWHNLGLTWEKQKNYPRALQSYKKGLKINPTYVHSLSRVGDIYAKTNRKELAKRYYLKASQYCDSCFDPVQSLATLYLSEGKYSPAIAMLRKFLGKEQQGVLPAERQKAKNLLRLAQRAGHRKK